MDRLFRVPPPLRWLARPHAEAIEAALGPIGPNPAFRGPALPWLFLCFTNRCGSNYLAQLLASTGACNEAGEFFNAETVLEHAAARALRSLHHYVETLPELVPSAPIFAAKASIDQLVMLTDAGILDAVADRVTFLYLERQDRLGQAISRVIAAQTGQWTSAQARAADAPEPQYDEASIAEELAKVNLAHAAFCRFFASNGIAPLHVSYEQLQRDPQSVIEACGNRFDLGPLCAVPERVTIQRQASPLNAAWRARFAAARDV